MGTFLKVVMYLLIVATFLTGCGGGGGSAPVNIAPPPPILSSDASLAGLSLSPGDLDQIFQSSLFAYTATVGYQQSSITVSATTTDSNANLTVNGSIVPSGQPSEMISLEEGPNTITVTVMAENGVTTQDYLLNLTRQSAFNFAQQAYIKASNTDAGNTASGDYFFFGHSVALFGDTLAVGAYHEASAATGINGDETDKSAAQSGAVYVFVRDGAGVWSQQAYIKASNTDAGDWFGYSVALSEDTLAVGANQERSSATGVNGNQADNSAEYSGAVYVYTRDVAGNWSQQAYIKASNTDANDRFGQSVALSGDTLAVAAKGDDSAAMSINGDETDNSATGAGAVYVFARNGIGDWSQQAYVKASNPDSSDGFGHRVALSGNTLAVTAAGEDSAATGVNGSQVDNSAELAGAAYVFTRDVAGNWNQQAYIKASNTDANDRFGQSVALSGDTLAVGTVFEESSASGINGDQFDNSVSRAGAVYIFTRNDAGSWSQLSYIKPSNMESGDYFGYSLALSEDNLVVGAYTEDSAAIGLNGDDTDNSADSSGAAYVFSRDDEGLWNQTGYVKASNTDSGDNFGWSVALSGDTLAVGARDEKSAATGVYGDETNNSGVGAGAVYVFH